eukprot:COSAG02_NODE_691_length_18445_cov_23.541099_12_plen_784_part_00
MSAGAALQKYGVTQGSAALPPVRPAAEEYGGSAPLPPGLIQVQRSEVDKSRATKNVAIDAACDAVKWVAPRERRRSVSIATWASVRSTSTRERSDHEQQDAHEDDTEELVQIKPRNSISQLGRTKSGRPPPGIKITGANQEAWEAFKRIDADCSGMLDETEVSELLKQLHITGISRRRLRRELRQIRAESAEDGAEDGGITFRVFAKWWMYHREIERRRARRDIKELFDSVDTDHSGELDRDELGRFVDKVGDKLDIDPAFDLVRDWKLMRQAAPQGVDGVTFPMFELWWRDRMGVTDGDLCVIPEFIAHQLTNLRGLNAWSAASGTEVEIDESYQPRSIWVGGIDQSHATEALVSAALAEFGAITAVHIRVKDGEKKCWALVTFDEPESADRALLMQTDWKIRPVQPEQLKSLHAQLIQVAQQVDTTSRGKALWVYMGSRLRRLIDIQQVWGEVQTMYDSRTASIYHSNPLPPLIRDPDSAYAAMWDALQVLLLVYLCVVIPLRACFSIDILIGSTEFYVDTFADLVFVLDVVLNFRTAFVDEHGVVEERPRVIARHYLRGWFMLDVLSCLPFQYLSSGGNFKAAKAVRLVRLTKMLRLSNLERTIGSHVGARYGMVSRAFSMIILFSAIVFAAHLLACLWYLTGTHVEPMPNTAGSVLTSGWVHNYYCCVDGEEPPCTQVCSEEQLAVVPVSTRYVSSMYLVFNALENANTKAEQLYAIGAEMTSGVIFGALAGAFSTLMMSINGDSSEVAENLRKLKIWLEHQMLPDEQQSRIMVRIKFT